MRKASLPLWVSFVFISANLFSQTYLSEFQQLPGVNYAMAAWADADGDGDLDLVYIGRDTAQQKIANFYKFENGAFQLTQSDFTPVMNGALAWGDFDNDNDLDLALAGASDNDGYITRIYRYDAGSGNFSWDQNINLEGTFYSWLCWGDLDNDGDLDLVVSGQGAIGSFTKIYRNDGVNGFTDQPGLPAELSNDAATATLADYDNDGDLDYLTASAIFKNHGSMSFVFDQSASDSLTQIDADRAKAAAWVDLDADGDLDAILTGLSALTDYGRVYLNDGSGGFTYDSGFSSQLENVREDVPGHAGDFNNDGTADFLSSGLSARLPLYDMANVFRNSNNTFALANDNLTGMARGAAGWGDFDNDGDLDAFVVGDSGHVEGEGRYEQNKFAAAIYRNSINSANQAPNAPTNLRVEFPAWNRVKLRWDAATDSETPNASLTYNLRVGTTPGGTEVMAPQANLQTGQRLLPWSGNAGHATFWHLDNLEPGTTYYWSVQAVDNGYRASAFAAEGQFSMPDSAFALSAAILPKVKNSLTEWLDYDNDGDLDILIYGTDENDATVLELYQNDGDFNFHFDAVATNNLPRLKNGTIAIGDWNNDNWLDIYLTGLSYGLRKAYLYQNTGASGIVGFEKAFGDWVLSMGFENASAAWQDVDLDGDQDLLVCGDTNDGLRTTLYENRGDRLWPDYNDLIVNGLTPVRNASISWGDFNADGWPDVLLSGDGGAAATRVLALFENNHDLTFSPLTPGFPGMRNGEAQLVDFDDDGDPDIVAGGDFNGADLKFFESGGNGDFAQALIYDNAEIGTNCAFDFGDFDNDGDFDFLYCGDDGGVFFARLFVYENGQYNTHPIFSKKLTGVRSGDIAFGDADGDGRLDILLSGELQSGLLTCRIYRSLIASVNDAPDPPAGLAAAVDYDAVQLTWQPAQDAGNDSHPFYNVRVGTSPGGNDIISPLADSLSGKQRFPVWANAGLNTSLSLLGLDYETTYYWSVQAVDRGQVASAWSDEVSFTTGPAPFTVHPLAIDELNFGSVEWGDYSDDGRLDFLTTGVTFERQSIFYRQAFGWLKDEVPSAFTDGVGRGTGIFGDYDHDGDLDVFMAGDGPSGAPIARLYRYINAGWFTFELDTASTAAFDSVMEADACWADFDNDGDLDLAVMGVSLQTGSEVRIYHNNGGEFALGAVLDMIYQGALAAADIDRDGWTELLVTGRNNDGRLFHLYKWTAAGWQNQADAIAAVVPVVEGDISLADFDNDGWLDLAVTGNAGTTQARVPVTDLYRNNHGIFQPFASFTGLYASKIAWGDYDHDGWSDFLLTGQEDINNSSGLLFQNLADQSFRLDEKTTGTLTDLGSGAVAWGDYDNDGDLDIVAEGTYPHLYTNNIAVQNQPPQPPENLHVSFVDSLTILCWSPAQDDHTPQPALTYNVRVGSHQNAIDIVSPMARDDGWRKIAQMGNAVTDTFFVLTHLSQHEGIYWSVQAIDQSFKGSEFSAEHFFTPAIQMEPVVENVQANGPAEARINMVFLAEGYRAQEMNKFTGDVQAMVNGIFGFEPFAEYRSYFNVYSIFVPSHESGASRKRDGDFRDTYFNATYETFADATQFLSIPPEDHYIPGIEEDYAAGLGKVDELIDTHVPQADMVTILINDNQYGGSAIRWRDRALALVAMSATAAHDIVHEIGHTIGLGDEYEFPLPMPKLEFPNTTSASQRENIVWNHWIDAATPVPTPEEAQFEDVVGLFEGANYSSNGWYRPMQSCKMRTNQNNTPFCVVCREWLIKAIYGYRWQTEGFPVPENRIRPLTLIQSREPQDDVLNLNSGEEATLQVETLAPATHDITFQWFIDGQQDEQLQLFSASFAADALGAGDHEISVVAYDGTDWVRADPQHFLSDTTTWHINIGGANAVRGRVLPQAFALAQNYPNPFNPQTTIRFALPQDAAVTLKIYATTGRLLRTLVQGNLPAGLHNAVWNGLDDAGRQVSSGVYIYKINAGTFSASRKLILLR